MGQSSQYPLPSINTHITTIFHSRTFLYFVAMARPFVPPCIHTSNKLVPCFAECTTGGAWRHDASSIAENALCKNGDGVTGRFNHTSSSGSSTVPSRCCMVANRVQDYPTVWPRLPRSFRQDRSARPFSIFSHRREFSLQGLLHRKTNRFHALLERSNLLGRSFDRFVF